MTVIGGLTWVELVVGLVLGSPLLAMWLLVCRAAVRGDDLRCFERIEAQARAKPGTARSVKPSMVAPGCICLPALLVAIPCGVSWVCMTSMGVAERVVAASLILLLVSFAVVYARWLAWAIGAIPASKASDKPSHYDDELD